MRGFALLQQSRLGERGLWERDSSLKGLSHYEATTADSLVPSRARLPVYEDTHFCL